MELTHSTTTEINPSVSEQTVDEEVRKLQTGSSYTKRNNRDKSSNNAKPSSCETHCYGCGGRHARTECKFRQSKCFHCGKKGHISKMCRSRTNHLSDSEGEEPANMLKKLNKIEIINSVKTNERKLIKAFIDGNEVEMELDTGSPCSIMNKNSLRKIKPHFKLLPTDRQFSSYSGHRVRCEGRLAVNVSIGNTLCRLNLYIVDGDFDNLMGREWISKFAREIDFVKIFTPSNQINYINTASPKLTLQQQEQLEEVLEKFKNIFSDVAGKLEGPPAKAHLKPDATPIFVKAREVPLALREEYIREVDAKIAAGLYKKVDYSEWASTTHVVAKKGGGIRITGNYKPTVNPRIIVDEHPIPKIDDLLNKIRGATIFCHLDVTDAYSHLTIDDEFAHILTLNTPTHGLIRPTRAVYGAANIPAIWQRRIENLLKDVPNVLSFFDDILVFGDSFEHMISSLQLILTKMMKQGLHLNRKKCVFATPMVEFLGHKIDRHGIHKSNKHIEAIQNAPKPSTPEELQLFLGKATYYNSFIPNLSTKSKPLRDMLKEKEFKWTKEANEAYSSIKETLISPQVLTPYDPALPLILATDASKHGLGAVLSHKFPNGLERPIAYASRAMTATEVKYPQIDKEALAIVWAVQKFFKYVYARHFTLVTDHKPLSQILHPQKTLSALCISRMANYSDFLSSFNYDVVYKPTKANANADFCSRISQPQRINFVSKTKFSEEEHDEFDDFIIRQMNQLPIRAAVIAQETKKDANLGKIVQILEQGQCLKKAGYSSPEVNYKLSSGCLVFDHRIVIPSKLREKILNDLHAAHLGIVKMKGMARSFVYWPGIDGDIERVAKSCNACSSHANKPAKFGDHHWEYPGGPWERIHIDYAGPFLGVMLLIVTDAFSKWIEVKVTSSTTSAATIQIMDEIFSAYGVPHTVVSDNGTNFSSAEFSEFLQVSGVTYHKQTAPYHPATNGQAERSVQTIKNALKTMGSTKHNIQSNINQFLRQYRNAPHSTTGQPPSMLFLGRLLRSRLDLVRPENINNKVERKQYLEYIPNFRTFKVNESVYFLSGNPRMDKWLRGIIRSRWGDLHYEIEFKGKTFKRHVDQIRSSSERTNPAEFHQQRRSKTIAQSPCSVMSPSDSQPMNGDETVSEDCTSNVPSTSNSGEPNTEDQNKTELREELLETEYVEIPEAGLTTPPSGEPNCDPIGAPRRSNRHE